MTFRTQILNSTETSQVVQSMNDVLPQTIALSGCAMHWDSDRTTAYFNSTPSSSLSQLATIHIHTAQLTMSTTSTITSITTDDQSYLPTRWHKPETSAWKTRPAAQYLIPFMVLVPAKVQQKLNPIKQRTTNISQMAGSINSQDL